MNLLSNEIAKLIFSGINYFLSSIIQQIKLGLNYCSPYLINQMTTKKKKIEKDVGNRSEVKILSGRNSMVKLERTGTG